MMLAAKMPRLTIAMGVAIAATFGVALMMQGLISSSGSVVEPEQSEKLVDFVRVKKDESTKTEDNKPKKPPVPPVEPPTPDMPKPAMDAAAANSLDIGGFEVATDINIDAGLTGGGGDGEYLPIVKVAPQYPRRAAKKGIEGYVVVEFTVTTLGTVKDVKVIEATPANIFNRAATNAAKKFKYKPKIENGKAVEVPGVRNIIRFELDKSKGKRKG